MAASERADITHEARPGHSEFDVATERLPREELPDYDPLEHRQTKEAIQPWMAYFNLLRTMLGPGLLGIPMAISASGLVVGSAFTIFIGILVIHTHHVLLNCLTLICRMLKVSNIPYRYAFRLALLHGPPIFHGIGRRGPTIIAIFMVLSQLGICTVCVILTADSLRDLTDLPTLEPALLCLLPLYLFMEYYMNNLHRISYVELFGSCLNTVGLSLLFYHIFKEPIREVVWFTEDVGGWLFSTGICMFNLSAVGVVLTLEKALKQPKIMTHKLGVINVGLGIPTICAALVGSLSYWAFGTMEENVLRSLPFDDATAMIILAVYLVSVALAFPLQCYTGVSVLLEVIKYHKIRPTPATLRLVEIILRPSFVTLAFGIAYYVPFQGPFVAFVGNLCSTMICVVFPVLMDTSLRYASPEGFGRWKYHLFKNIAILIFGVLIWIFGVYYCAYIIYIRILSLTSPNADNL